MIHEIGGAGDRACHEMAKTQRSAVNWPSLICKPLQMTYSVVPNPRMRPKKRFKVIIPKAVLDSARLSSVDPGMMHHQAVNPTRPSNAYLPSNPSLTHSLDSAPPDHGLG
jgi:hypothetical protein